MKVARKKIVVLGAGFGGLTFCQEFAHPDADVVLIDRQNHHLFQPLLYQVATAGLSATDIAQPIRGILSDYPQVTVLMDEVRGIDLNLRRIELGRQTLDYDYLVMALGGVTSYFGHPEWEPFAPGLKSLDDALKIRRSILFAFERAEMSTSVEERKRLTTIVVVGGGPTGVELSGAFAELARTVLNKDFRHIDPAQARVVLIEASPRVLAHFPEDLSRNAREQLEKLGVEVHTGVKVLDVKQGLVETSIGPIDAENVIWGAGVGANPLGKQLGAELDRAGRVKVAPDCSVPGHPEAFVLGDMAALTDAKGVVVPGVSPAAIQMAQYTASIIRDELNGVGTPDQRKPFAYWDKGSMATIGRSAAVAEMGDFHFTGFVAWMAWLGVHLLFLVGFRNKIAVLIQWAYSYFTYKRGSRIITGLALPKPEAKEL